jgi:hypothetical protein
MADRYQGGNIWSEVRTALVLHSEELVEAFNADRHERESAILDSVARNITKRIEPMIETYSLRSK